MMKTLMKIEKKKKDISSSFHGNHNTEICGSRYEATVPKTVLFGTQMRKKPFSFLSLTLYSIDTHQQQTVFENIVGKEEIARYEQFLLFPTMFSTQSENCIHICQYF